MCNIYSSTVERERERRRGNREQGTGNREQGTGNRERDKFSGGCCAKLV